MEPLKTGSLKEKVKRAFLHQSWRKVITVMAGLVVFSTTYALILPAITMSSQKASCGYEEHEHSDACYDGDGNLICPLEEHLHTLACYSDLKADIENEEIWRQEIPALTGDAGSDILNIAAGLVGYRESDSNYLVSDDEKTQGYSRFGHWYGEMISRALQERAEKAKLDPPEDMEVKTVYAGELENNRVVRLANRLPAYAYLDWDAMFVSYVLNYAQVSDFGYESDAGNWAGALAASGKYMDAEGYIPSKGDLIFFTEQSGGKVKVGIVSGVHKNMFGFGKDVSSLSVIIGDHENAVEEVRVAVGDYTEGDKVCDKINGYGVLVPKDPSVNQDESAAESIVDFFTDLFRPDDPESGDAGKEREAVPQEEEGAKEEKSIPAEEHPEAYSGETDSQGAQPAGEAAAQGTANAGNKTGAEDESVSGRAAEDKDKAEKTEGKKSGEESDESAPADESAAGQAAELLPDPENLADAGDESGVISLYRYEEGVDKEKKGGEEDSRVTSVRLMKSDLHKEDENIVMEWEISARLPENVLPAGALIYIETGTGKMHAMTALQAREWGGEVLIGKERVSFAENENYELSFLGSNGTFYTWDEVKDMKEDAVTTFTAVRVKVLEAVMAGENGRAAFAIKTTASLKEANTGVNYYITKAVVCGYSDSDSYVYQNGKALAANPDTIIQNAGLNETGHTADSNEGKAGKEKDSDSSAINERSKTLTASGSDYRITVGYDYDAAIPKMAKLKVTEIRKGTKEYGQYLKDSRQALGIDEDTGEIYGRFFDISIITKDGEYEPKAPVIVNVEYSKAQKIEERAVVSAVHIDEEGAAQIASDKISAESAMSDGLLKNVAFEADSFSVYGIVYTVDFHWDVDGKSYEISLPGGGYVSLEALVEVMGLAHWEVPEADDLTADADEDAEAGLDEAAGTLGDLAEAVFGDAGDGSEKTAEVGAAGSEAASLGNAGVGSEKTSEAETSDLEVASLGDAGDGSEKTADAGAAELSAAEDAENGAERSADKELAGDSIPASSKDANNDAEMSAGTEAADESLGYAAGDLTDESEKAVKVDPEEASKEIADGDASDPEVIKSEPESLVVLSDRLTLNDVEISEVTKKFVANVDSVEFSDPSLMWIGRNETDSTVGEIKEANDLNVQYSSELSPDQIAEIDAQTVAEGDWVLISLRPFDTDEVLTIHMKNGEVFRIRVTDEANAPMVPGTDQVQTVPNPAGTTIELFDYWVDTSLKDNTGRSAWPDYSGDITNWKKEDNGLYGTGNEAGINQNHAFKFSPAWEETVTNGTGGTNATNNWNNKNGYRALNCYTGNANPMTGLVENQLEDGYPKLTNDSDIGTTGESLEYLFNNDKTEYAGYRQYYGGVNQFLYVDPDGYYCYDSDSYKATLQPDNTMVVEPQGSTSGDARGFWPFGTEKYWMGMHMKTDFSMPADGQVLNPNGEYKDMQFEFSGDDDCWLYVDNVLVGDAGGVHNSTTVIINFATGEVRVTGQLAPNHAGDYDVTKSLYRIFAEAKGEQNLNPNDWVDVDGDGVKDTFRSGTYHTFDMYYLERGGGESNLYLKYNLVSTADFTGHKAYEGFQEGERMTRDQFKYQLIGLDGRYEYVGGQLVQTAFSYGGGSLAADKEAIMPVGGSAGGAGTVADPKLEDGTYYVNGSNVDALIYTTGVTEDGNINFGSALINSVEEEAHTRGHSSVYRYIVKEVMPPGAEPLQDGYLYDGVIYDDTVYYMTAEVTSWQVEDPSTGDSHFEFGLNKRYYEDATFTVEKEGAVFVDFRNVSESVRYGSVEFTKTDALTEGALEGAEFVLCKDEECTSVASNRDGERMSVKSDASGRVAFENVAAGTYYMKEKRAPQGYALPETIYRVVIEDAADSTKHSRITVLGEDTEITEIENEQPGTLGVRKKWVNGEGVEVNGGSNSAKVRLFRKKEKSTNVQVVFHREGQGWDLDVGDYKTVLTAENYAKFGVYWQFDNGKSVKELKINGNVLDPWNQTHVLDCASVDGRQWDGGDFQHYKLEVTNVTGDLYIEVTTDSDYFRNKPLNFSEVVESSSSYTEPEHVTDVDPVVLNSGNGWKQTWTVGGTLLDHTGYDLPATDDAGKKYLYSIVELDENDDEIDVGDEAADGMILTGYSANNDPGVPGQGVLTATNEITALPTVDINIKKTDGSAGGTNYLAGAVFELDYRADSSASWQKANAVLPSPVTGLDAESSFTTSGTSGGITLSGLPDGQYQLKEIDAPEGYVIKESTPVIFTVSGGTIIETSETQGVIHTNPSGSDPDSYTIPNSRGVALPHTGGEGTDAFYLFGGLLALAGGLCMVLRKRREMSA